MAQILVAAGPLVAILSSRDSHHRQCVALLDHLAPPLLTCWPVITEAAWLLRHEPVALDALLKFCETGFLRILPMDGDSIPQARQLMTRYSNIGAQLADAALLYLAETENVGTVFTLDHRDFQVYRIKRNRRLRLLPEVLQ